MMNKIQKYHSDSIVPEKLKKGDRVQIAGISRSLGGIIKLGGFSETDVEFAKIRIEKLGLNVFFTEHSRDYNEHLSTSVENRIEELHNAFTDPSIQDVLAVSGGIGAVQLLEEIDYDLISRFPKVLCGYSDFGNLSNAIFAKTGMITYYGPNFSSFMMRQGFEYSMEYFEKCLFDKNTFDIIPSKLWSDDNWTKDQDKRNFYPNEGYWAISEGLAEGTIIGGNLFALNRLQGSDYFPSLDDAIIFCEFPGQGKATLLEIDSSLRVLSFQPGFKKIRGIVIGRFSRDSHVESQSLEKIIRGIPNLKDIPVMANVDFGHTTPMATIPIGGRCVLESFKDKIRIKVTLH